jgi:large subunit ribosomal protein L24
MIDDPLLHDAWMQDAVELAQRGRGEVEPNPRVGCLLLKDGVVVARGWHEHYGGRHAEAMALDEARHNGVRPDTAVVTLEPCSTPKGQDGKKKPVVGQILKVLPDEDRVIISGVNMVKRHTKQSARTQGGIVTKEAPVHVSNIAHVDPKSGEATRIGFKTLQDGRKVRFAKKSGEVIDV